MPALLALLRLVRDRPHGTPGRTDSNPSTTTRSPDCSPCSMIQLLPTRSPVFTGRASILLSAPDHVNGLNALVLLNSSLRNDDDALPFASSGTGPARTGPEARTAAGSGNRAWTSRVPVRGST